MNSIKNEIIKKLGTIKYPEFNRDIISFGILKDIIIDDENTIKILLNLNTNNIKHRVDPYDGMNLTNLNTNNNNVRTAHGIRKKHREDPYDGLKKYIMRLSR